MLKSGFIRKASLGVLLMLWTHLFSYAQSSIDSTSLGSIKGRVKDSLYNFMLVSSTVAVYKVDDSSIVKFTLPNEFGEFSLFHIPIQVPLKLVITHVGYRPIIKHFLLTPHNKNYDMGVLNMYINAEMQATNEEVIVTAIAPMRMKGDTLEFNPNAFRLDSNATAEDLMRRLPGFTIWGDGEITFNGKKLQAVLVDGKPFFGTNITVATQNLPKEVISRVQVYQQTNEHNPYDSTLYANIKLKEGKGMGYFGKVSIGIGSNGRYAGDAMISQYNKKMQLSVVGAKNNVNKIARNVNELIKNSSFKGEGANIEYQPDLSVAGVTEATVAGIQWQYDFLPDVKYFRKHRTNADYFHEHTRLNTDENGFLRIALGPDSVQTQLISNKRIFTRTQHILSNHYDKTMNDYAINVGTNLSYYRSQLFSDDLTTLKNSRDEIVGNSQVASDDENSNKKYRLNLQFQRFKEGDQKRRVPTNFTFEYDFGRLDNREQALRKIINNTFVSPAVATIFNRKYNNSLSDNNHTITITYPSFKRLIFGKNIGLADLGIGLRHTLNIQTLDYKNEVLDKDLTREVYKKNNYLTINRNEQIENHIPSIYFYKNFTKTLTHRFYKYFNVNLDLRGQHYSFKSVASRNIQNVKYKHSFFIPTAIIEYNNHQYGNRETKYTLNYITEVTYPQVQQLAPLIDSSNFWYFPIGNINLLPEIERKLSIQYSFTTRKPKNPLNINLFIQASKKTNAFSDSVIFDQVGRRVVYPINVEGNRNMEVNLSIKKAMETKRNTFQVQVQNRFIVQKTPQFVNSIQNVSRTIANEAVLNLDYSVRDKLAFKVQQGQTIFISSQQGFNDTRFVSNNLFTRLIAALEFPNNFLWSSNVTYNHNTFNNSSPINITIWNASLSYRFLKGEKGEFKFSAMDLLNQNRNIVNNNIGNTQFFRATNTLRQYFMLTISYYPRRFGK